MSKKTPSLPGFSPPTRRVKMLVKRAIVARKRGGALYDKATTAIAKARQCGLALNQPVEIELPGEDGQLQKVSFELVDNFVGPVAYKSHGIPHFELKKVPKARRAETEVSP